MSLSKLDKKILNKYFKKRNPSYSEIAKELNISRSTVYRKMKKLEKENKISRGSVILPNYEKLGFSMTALGITTNKEDEEKVINLLKKEKCLSVLFKSYLSHSIVALFICEDGEKGKFTREIKSKLKDKDIDIQDLDISIGVSIEEVNLLPRFTISEEEA